MKYKVTVLPPTSKRMIGNGKIIITLSSGWGGDRIFEHTNWEKDSDFLFEIPDEYIHISESNKMGICDGPVFEVEVEYSNSTKSRKENIFLKPIKVI